MSILLLPDVLRSVTIIPPSQVFQGRVPTSISLIFASNITTVYGTDMLGITGYSWDFMDNTGSVDGPTVSHSYSVAGDYNVRLIVYLHFFENNQDTLAITVYQGKTYVYFVRVLKNTHHVMPCLNAFTCTINALMKVTINSVMLSIAYLNAFICALCLSAYYAFIFALCFNTLMLSPALIMLFYQRPSCPFLCSY